MLYNAGEGKQKIYETTAIRDVLSDDLCDCRSAGHAAHPQTHQGGFRLGQGPASAKLQHRGLPKVDWQFALAMAT
jgi:hypothetical protein